MPALSCKCGDLLNKTICMDSIQYVDGNAQTHYDVHSLYGDSMAKVNSFKLDII